MAVRRSQNWLNQLRVDVPHIRSVESAVRNDFDEMLGAVAVGENKSYFVRGFEINMVGAIGASASALQLIVENSSFLHGASNESGTFFQVPTGTPNETLNATTNTRIQGSFTPSTTNYVGVEFVRAVDNSTTAQVFLWNPTNKTEVEKTVPLAETLDYNIVITSSIWASNVLPLALVETDGSNSVIEITDQRAMLLRLGSAGSSAPNPFNTFQWAEGRDENPSQSSTATSPFEGGDKQLLHLKDWMDAMASMMLEVKGTTYWYSENKGGSLVKLRGDLAHTQMTGSGKFIHALATAGRINWDNDIFLDFIGSRLSYKIASNAATSDITLADNQVAYFKIIRGVDIVPKLIFTNGSAIVSSVGAVSWTTGLIAGDFVKVGSKDDTRYFEIQSVDSASQVTLTVNFDGTSTGSSGVTAKYAFGTYQTDPAPSTDRHIRVANREDVPFQEDTHWLFLRADNGSAAAKVYIKGSSGGELEQGEERQISDNQTDQILEYTGAPSEVDATPNYTNAIVTGVAESRTITFPAAAALTSGERFEINSALDLNKYYSDTIIDAVPADPAPAGLTRIAVNILSTDTNIQVAAKYHSVINVLGDFNSTDNLDGTLTVVNSQVGVSTNAANVDMGVGFSVVTDTEGVGAFNHVLVDDENLTKGEKRLDGAIQDLAAQINTDPYEEKIDIIAGAPSNDREVTGPVVAGTNIKLPKNTRNSDVQETYVVGEADVVLFLNGIRLCVTDDYVEIGAPLSESINVQLTFDLLVGDVLKFQKAEIIGASAGGAASGVNLGVAQDANVFKQVVTNQFQFRRLAAGANISIVEDSDKVTIASSAGVGASTVINVNGVNHTLLTTEDVALVTNSGADRTITLPDATAANGKRYDIKKIDGGNTVFVKSVSSQTLDGVDIDATPKAISIQFENLTVISNGVSWWII